MSDFDKLPEILLPDALPAWLVDGFAGDDDTAYARVEMSTGHDRKRRVYRRPPIKRNVSMMLTEAQALQFESWFERDLLGGELRFSARVRDMGPGHIWYSAQFAGQPNFDFQHWAKGIGAGHWLITAELILYGVGSDFGPDLTPFKAAITVPLTGRAKGFVPASLQSAITVPLTGVAAHMGLQAGVDVALTGSVAAVGAIGLQASVDVALAAVAAPVRTTLFKANIEVQLL